MTIASKNQRKLVLLLLIHFLINHLGCSISSSSSGQMLIKTCNVPSDQSGTISGHWPKTPIPIAFHQGDFNPTETGQITAAIDTWNYFYSASIGIPTISYGSAGSPTLSTSQNPAQLGALCGQGVLSSGQFSGNIVIYKLGQWPTSYPTTAMALTSFCINSTNNGSYPNMYMAVIEVNYQNFFSAGNKIPDLQTIFLHELGHLLGLNHSCEATPTKAGVPNCNAPSLNPDYNSAIMYPVFTFDTSGAGQVKRTLGQNDESRANCLYSGPSGPQ